MAAGTGRGHEVLGVWASGASLALMGLGVAGFLVTGMLRDLGFDSR
ncbi:hypothetical protein ACIBBE_21700 [Streptomyces sp. NPDC051644]